ncbi:hypothetical protein [Lentisphaera araneosa]|uniref:hypothetical protein n=1 Tax=Lentisphaera araneosa TaxID=256847 RepID=UPI000593B31A|nr:hypothetical protein [Lentisphaera araneosa]
MKTTIITLIIFIILTACKSNHEQSFFDTYSSEQIQSAVNNFYLENPDNLLYKIPSIEIYNHSTNICVVTKRDKQYEYGYYFAPYVSSFIQIENEEWKFTYFKNRTEYRRKL